MGSSESTESRFEIVGNWQNHRSDVEGIIR